MPKTEANEALDAEADMIQEVLEDPHSAVEELLRLRKDYDVLGINYRAMEASLARALKDLDKESEDAKDL